MVIQTLQRGAQKSGELRAVFHQVQQVLAVGMEAFQLFWAGEELRQRGLPVKLGLRHSHHLHVGEGLSETAGRHPKSTEDIGQKQPVSWPKKTKKKTKQNVEQRLEITADQEKSKNKSSAFALGLSSYPWDRDTWML